MVVVGAPLTVVTRPDVTVAQTLSPHDTTLAAASLSGAQFSYAQSWRP